MLAMMSYFIPNGKKQLQANAVPLPGFWKYQPTNQPTDTHSVSMSAMLIK